MLVLITGGSGSGKSEFAENKAMEYGGDKLYIATMKPYDDECIRKIERHRALRACKNFRSVECYENLNSIREGADTMLVECISNLTANVMFSQNGDKSAENIVSGVVGLKCKNLVVVTNEVSSDGCIYDKKTKDYISLLGEINSRLGEYADEIYEVVYGIPVKIKEKDKR